MKLVTGFLRLVRWPNLVFIAITQILFQYCIIHPAFAKAETQLAFHHYFWWLLVSSVLIAAAGYIINDYFDLNIDQINKPDKLIVEKLINRRWVILWHLFLSFIGIAISFWIAFKCNMIELGFANMLSVFLLFIYSTTLKKKLLSGNLLISLLTAWVILVIGIENVLHIHSDDIIAKHVDEGRLMRLTFLYAGFAFIISLIREVVKDCEDMEGDRKFGCRTMPIVWGVTASKIFVGTWLVVLVLALGVTQFYVLQFGWWLSAVYSFVFILTPLLYIFYLLKKAITSKDFHQLSTYIKVVMFTGILSMVFFYFL
jgi:4-hydroxybenzoate polyprenyltransferase